jgi:hypothetical protein
MPVIITKFEKLVIRAESLLDGKTPESKPAQITSDIKYSINAIRA